MPIVNVSDLRRKRKELIAHLRKIDPMVLQGSLIERYKKCGKPNCHCVKSQGHGPHYYLSVSVAGGRSTLVYVPAKYKLLVEQALTQYREIQKIIEEISDINRKLLITT